MGKVVNFELSENQHIDFEEYDNAEFGIAKMNFISTTENSHKLSISKEVLMEYAPTALGKWVVSKLNFTKTDLEGHEPDEQIIGLIPKDQEIEFIEDENGETKAYADVVISKVYAKDFCDILQKNGSHAVSVEMEISSEEGKGMDDTVEAFNIIGVTVLGTQINPSVPEANIEFVRFAEQAENFFKEKDKVEFNSTENNETNNEEKEGESKMAEIEKTKDVVENNDSKEAEKDCEFAEPEKEAKSQKTEMENHNEAEQEDPKKDEDPKEPEKTEMSADEMKAEMARLQEEIEDKKNIIMDKDAEMAEMKTELAELRAYKNTCMQAEKANKVETVMAEVSKFMDKETAKQCREKGMKCEFSELDGWANEAKASVYDKAVKSAKKEAEEFTRMSAVGNIERKEMANATPLDKLKNQYLI